MAAALWNVLREEVRGTVDDFKQKGAVGAFRDAALDAMDMAKDVGGMVAEGAKRATNAAVGTGETFEGESYLVGPNVPKRGATAELRFINGESTEATIIDVDGVSDPPRARVTASGMEQPVLVPILDPKVADELIANGALDSNGPLSFLHKELSMTVQEFREKGAVGVLKDATLDIVDMGTDTAKSAVDVAKSAAPTMTGATVAAVGYIGDTAKSAVDTAKTTAAYGVATEHAGSLINGISDTAKSAVDTAKTTAVYGVATEHAGSLITGIKGEWNETVQELREKGAVGTVRDAAFDAADIIGTTASSAVTTASGVIGGPTARVVVDHAGTTASSAMETASTVVNSATFHASKLLGGDGSVDSSTGPEEGQTGKQEPVPAESTAVPPVAVTAAPVAVAAAQEAATVAAKATADATAATATAAAAGSPSKTTEGESPSAVSPAVERTPTPVAEPFSPPPRFSGPPAESRAQEKPAPAQAAQAAPPPAAKTAAPAQEKPAPAQAAKTAPSPTAKVAAPDGAARKSIVSRRRDMFEKSKPNEPKSKSEELID